LVFAYSAFIPELVDIKLVQAKLDLKRKLPEIVAKYCTNIKPVESPFIKHLFTHSLCGKVTTVSE